MGRTFTRDDVLRLAPDAGSAKSGQELAQVRKWASLGADDEAAWGECQGSGAKPYQVQIELAEPAFKCSCPSRKFPCKHGLGLLLILAATPEALAKKVERPAWVVEWLAARTARAAKAAEEPSRKRAAPDPASQAKRREQRIERARAGLSELSAWIQDLIRTGLGGVPAKGFAHFDGQARRMVDAQAPGVARLVRQLGSLASSGAGWQRTFLEQLALLHLLTRAVDRFDELPETVRADVESAVGVTTAVEQLAELSGVNDDWQVFAQENELEDRLRVQRNWLVGVATRRVALVLQFAHGTAAFESTLSPGTQFHGELVYYPGSGVRASIRQMQTTGDAMRSLAAWESIDEVLEQFSAAIASNPWLEQVVLPLKHVTPLKSSDDWFVVDAAGAALPAKIREPEGFALLAVSGGAPVDLAVSYDGRALRPLAVIAEGEWLSLVPSIAEASAR